jgi:hypothetical protein
LVIVTSEILSDKGTVVHGGVITVSTENATVSRPIIMKVGFYEDKSLIESEYNIYTHLQQNGVPIHKVHGLFQDRDPDNATAILMDYAGTRIDQVPGGLSETQRCVCSLVPIVHPLIQLAEHHSADFFNRFIMQEFYIMISLHETC